MDNYTVELIICEFQGDWWVFNDNFQAKNEKEAEEEAKKQFLLRYDSVMFAFIGLYSINLSES